MSSEPEQSPEELEQPREWLNRFLYGLIIASVFLPFATVKGCSGEVEQSYTGVDLMKKEAGFLLIGVILFAVLLLALSFRRRVRSTLRRGLVQGSKALLSALAALTAIFVTGMTFMFDRVSEQIGLFICVGSWALLYALSMFAALKCVVLLRRECPDQPPPWGLSVSLLLAATFTLTAWLSEPMNPGELIFGLTAGLFACAPLVPIAMLAAVYYRQRTGRSSSRRNLRRSAP
jgi:hypothetical protein